MNCQSVLNWRRSGYQSTVCEPCVGSSGVSLYLSLSLSLSYSLYLTLSFYHPLSLSNSLSSWTRIKTHSSAYSKCLSSDEQFLLDTDDDDDVVIKTISPISLLSEKKRSFQVSFQQTHCTAAISKAKSSCETEPTEHRTIHKVTFIHLAIVCTRESTWLSALQNEKLLC